MIRCKVRMALFLCVLVCVCLCANIARTGDLLLSEKKLYSQYDEEVIIRDFFQDRRDGTFVDIGASHYQKFSNTYYLEKHLGWSGVAVDAIEDYAAEYKMYRPRTQFFAYVVTDSSGAKQPFYKIPRLPEVSSTNKQWIDSLNEGPVETVMVPSIALNDLLDRVHISKFDFLSLDIEEGEPAALAGFDIQRFHPELVCVEQHESVRMKLLEYFKANNYERIDKYIPYDKSNWYFRPKKN